MRWYSDMRLMDSHGRRRVGARRGVLSSELLTNQHESLLFTDNRHHRIENGTEYEEALDPCPVQDKNG